MFSYVDVDLVRDPNPTYICKLVDPTQKNTPENYHDWLENPVFSIGNTVDGRNPAPVDMRYGESPMFHRVSYITGSAAFLSSTVHLHSFHGGCSSQSLVSLQRSAPKPGRRRLPAGATLRGVLAEPGHFQTSFLVEKPSLKGLLLGGWAPRTEVSG